MLTEMAGYVIAPGAMHLNTFLWAGIGTGLCSSSANALNQVCTESTVFEYCFFVLSSWRSFEIYLLVWLSVLVA